MISFWEIFNLKDPTLPYAKDFHEINDPNPPDFGRTRGGGILNFWIFAIVSSR
jgi:hypothetical protein